MGVIRSILMVIISVLLFLSLFSLTLFGVLSSSLNYENIEKNSVEVIKNYLNSEFDLTNKIEDIQVIMQKYCESNPNSDYVFNYDGNALTIPCEVVLQGGNAIIEEGIKGMIRNNYYTEYECNFFDCIKESPLFLISEKSYDYLNNKFYFFLLASFILAGVFFIFTEKKTNTFLLAGSSLIISSIIFIKIDSFFLLSNTELFKVLGVFFSESFNISVKVLIAGIILLITGLILKLFKIGFNIENFISKFKKSQFSEEKSKSQQIPVKKKMVKKKFK